MTRNGFFGVKNAHAAFLTDEENLTYSTVFAIPGTVQIQANTAIEDSTCYADDEVWIDESTDNGFEGTMSFRDIETDAEMRANMARMTGYALDNAGRVVGLTGKAPEPFAFFCEQTGKIAGKRRCWFKVTLEKPSMDASTKEATADIKQMDYPFKARPITVSDSQGRSASASFIDTYPDNADWLTFFNSVNTSTIIEAAYPSTSSGNAGSGD